METESDSHLTFQHLDIYSRPDGSLGHKVYRKPTHTNIYHSAKSHHHPSNKLWCTGPGLSVMKTACRPSLGFLRDVFRQNGYNDWQIHSALNRRSHLNHRATSPTLSPFCPLSGTIFRISRGLARHNIKSVGLPHITLSSLLRPVQDHLGLRTPGVYRIPCEAGRVYTGQAGRSVGIR
jgi:hypothetical protein